MTRRDAWIAATRFGLGPKPGELDTIASDPRGWLLDQLNVDVPVPKPLRDLEASELIPAFRSRGGMTPMATAQKAFRKREQKRYVQEEAARIRTMLSTKQPFRERLVAFWSNHFSVSVERGAVRGLVGAFEREAIRAQVTAPFIRMLSRSTRHPAMLLYLDNHQSVGPGSRAAERARVRGRERGRGLNENLAREILELHTVGIGHYGQVDVEAFANILTGWGVARPTEDVVGGFQYRPKKHEPGDKMLLGTVVPFGDESEGRSALERLARHPATAQHIATKLARHFAADDPPPTLVKALAERYLSTNGDLREVAKLLVTREETWAGAGNKVRSPFDLVMAAGRALDLTAETVADGMRMLHQRTWKTASPAGWPDTTAAWLGPESLLRRLDWARRVQKQVLAAGAFDVKVVAEDITGPALTPAVQEALDGPNGVSLWLASPSFQRR